MTQLGSIAVLLGVPAAASADPPCIAPRCWVVDDARTVVTDLGEGRVRVEMFYADGAQFARGEFRRDHRDHPVFWQPIGRGVLYYPDGKLMSSGPAPEHHGGITAYWLADGRLFARVRFTRHGPEVVALGPAISRHPKFSPCSRGRRLQCLGPTWVGVSSAKFFPALLRPLELYCGAKEWIDARDLRSRWGPDGEPRPLDRRRGALRIIGERRR